MWEGGLIHFEIGNIGFRIKSPNSLSHAIGSLSYTNIRLEIIEVNVRSWIDLVRDRDCECVVELPSSKAMGLSKEIIRLYRFKKWDCAKIIINLTYHQLGPP